MGVYVDLIEGEMAAWGRGRGVGGLAMSLMIKRWECRQQAVFSPQFLPLAQPAQSQHVMLSRFGGTIVRRVSKPNAHTSGEPFVGVFGWVGLGGGGGAFRSLR